jgi:phage-related protein
MNEVEYVLRIILQARDELAGALKKAREELRHFANAIDSHKAKIDAFNTSIQAMDKNVTDVTNKFKDWRAVMEGTAGENAKAKKSFGDLGREVDSTAKAQTRHADAQIKAARAQDALLKSADKLRNEYRKLSTEEAKSDKNREFTLFRLQAIGRELESLSKKVDDPAIRRFYFNWAQDSKRAADAIVSDNKRVEESNKQLIKGEEEAAANRQRIRDRDAAARAAFARTFAIREKISGDGERDFIDIAEAKQTITVLRQVAKGYDDNSKMARRLRGEAERLNAELRNTGREANNTSGVFRTLVNELRNNSDSIATLDNQFRGLGLLAVIGFAQQLITVLGGLAGSLFAVASSAAEAAASLGGMATAGLAQAIPVIGLLGAAFAQAKGAMDAMKQAQLERQQAAVQGASADRRNADAADAVAAAQKRLRDAQTGLTKAREDGRKELEDLIQAENDAKLAAIGAALSQKEAQQALVKAQATGDTAGIQRAQLALLQAQSDATDSLTQKKRAAAEADKGREGGVEGLDSVKRAADQVKTAQRGIQTAKRNADEAAKGTDTAAAKLQFLLSQMTAGQRALFRALEALRKVYIQNFGPISDIILGSFTRVVKRITTLLQSPEILGAARKLATEISRQLNRITDAFLGDKMIAQFLRIAEQARTNLKPVTDIIIDLGKAFFNIAEAAGPSFSKFLGFVGDLVGAFADLTGNQDKMTKFFDTGEEHLEAWIKLGLAIIRLFLALAGAGGAESGLGMVEDLTKAIEGLITQVDEHREDVVKFFEDARHVAEEVLGVIVALAEELFKAFTPERVDNFATLIKDVILPALGDVVEFLGNATAKLVEFSETPLGGEILKGLVAFFVLSKVLSGVLGSFKAFGTFLIPIVKALGQIGGKASVFARMGAVVEKLAPTLARVAGFATRFLGIVGAVVALLHWLGLLDEAWDAIKGGFEAFYKEVEPSLRKLFKAFKELGEVAGDFFGTLRSVLRPIVKVLIEIGGIFLRVFGRTLGRIIGGAIDVLTGIITFITGVFTGDWRKAWSGIRQIFRGVFRAIGAIFRALPELIGDIAKKVLPAFRKGISALWNWLEKLPGRLKDLAADAAQAFVDGFKSGGIGEKIIKGIVSGLKSGVGFAKDVANAFIDLLNKLLPNKLSIPGAPDINLPNNPIPHLAGGGPVPGTGRGDRIAALLEPGEHVLTRQEVAAMGGHGAVFALRRALGGGGQGSGGRFAQGGAAAASAGSLTITFQGGSLDDFRSAWRQFWTSLVLISRQGSNLVEAQFRDMRVSTTRSADRMYRDVRSSIADIQKSFDVRGKRIVDSWSDMWMSLKKVTAEGLFYIGHETNKALTALGEKHIDFHLTAPKKADDGKAGGGWIGSKGQRGRDMGFYPLGAGEAVLNWQHQKYVEPAMNAYYGHGLGTMFDRVHGYHAGGGGTGYAGGRPPQFRPIPGMPGEEAATRAIPTILKLIKQYHVIITDAFDRDRSAGHKSPGHNVTGTAIDAVPGPGGSWNTIEAMGRWAVGKGMTVGYGAGVSGSQAWPGHGRGNHIHIELGGNPAAVVDFVTKIGRPLVKGGGELARLSQAAIDMVLKAANATLAETIPETSGATNFKLGPGGPAQKVFDFFTGRGLSDAIAAGFVGTFQKESGFVTTVTNAAGSGATGLAQWLGGRLAALKAKPNWDSLQTQLNFVWEELHGAESGAFAKIKGARTPEEAAQIIDSQYERSDNILNAPSNARQAYNKFHGTGKPRKFAAGGIVPGPDGQPVPILAHAQEWILNSGQVNRIASMLGTSRAALRSMMGFYGGGAAGYQGGGQPAADEIAALTPKEVKGIDNRMLQRVVRALRRLSASMLEAASGIGSVESWSGVLSASLKNLDQVTKRVKAKSGERKKKDTDFDRGIFAFVDAVDGLLADTTGAFAKLRASIERRASVMARRLLRRQFTVARGGVVSRADLGTEEQVAETLAERDLGEARRQRPELVRERNRIRGTLRRVRRQQRRGGLSDAQKARLQAEENQLQGMLDEAKQRVTDNVSAIYEAQQAYLQAQLATQQAITDGITKRYELANANIDRQKREATALGNVGQLRNLAQQSIDNLNGLANEINSRIDATRAIGTREAIEAADAMAEQVRDLRTQVIEATAQMLRDDVERVNTRVQRSLSFLDIRGRVTDVLERAGGRQTAAQQRVGQARERTDLLAQQRADIAALRNRAALEGNTGVMEELDLQLAELDATIAENNQTTQELIIANHQLTSEIIKSTTDRTTGLLGIGQSIIEKIGAGFIDPNKTLPFLQAIGAAIASAAGKLVTEIRSVINDPDNPFGIFATRAEPLLAAASAAFQAGPEAFAQWLLTNAPAIAQLIEEMGGPGSPMGQLFGGLIDELGNNTVAQLDNTQATNELSGNLSKDQGFTSTAWEVFSQAIFTGSGGLMPMYQSLFPSAQVGANVINSGMLMAHAGERIVPAKVAALSGGGNMGDTNYFDIDINEAGRPIDWAGAATQIMFKKSGAK